jgi:hypothetical protein
MGLMKNIVTILLLGLSLLAPQLALSHASHGAPLNDQQAMEKAIEYTGMIIEKPDAIKGVTLDDSWKAVTETNIHKKDLRYFIVSLYNASQNKTLYLLINSYGELYDANFDGTFDDL